jgi:peptidoglycan/LPS O-acetylase OafA/YrhL
MLRAIAILWVMLFHMRFLNLPGVFHGVCRYGWMGVDIFFVLSGYLIGSQLLRPYTKDSQPSIGGFYLRRAFRVLPAYLTVLLLYLTVPGFREAPGLSPAWQFLTFTENFRIDYATDQAFSHVWSLCVEEHFYLTLPLLVLALMWKPRFGKALAVILAVLCFGIAIRAYIYIHQLNPLLATDPDSFTLLYVEKIYYPTHTRLDGLLVGVVLATIKTFRPAWWQRALSHGNAVTLAGLGISAFAMWLFRDRLAFTANVFGFPLLALGLGLLLIASVSPASLLSKARGFGFIATLAYSMYLTHKEIINLDQKYLLRYTGSSDWMALLFYFATSFLVASVLYFAVERPFLRLREKTSARTPYSAVPAAAGR